MDFRSDNTAAIAPALFDAMARVNHGSASGYGSDALSLELDRKFSEFFDTDVVAFTVSTGTAANGLALAHLCPPWGRIIALDESHIVRDECGASAFFSGAQIEVLSGDNAKMSQHSLKAFCNAYTPSVHASPLKVLSLTQATERGTVYTPDELQALGSVAREHGMKVHLDGARFVNALIALDCSPADISWRAGVDVLCFGATKNGGLACEAVIFFDRGLAEDFSYRRKRAGQLGCKSRYAAAQWLAYLDPQVWRNQAKHANECARQIAEAAGETLVVPVQTNQVFLRLTQLQKALLRGAGFQFYDWGSPDRCEARFVTSWQSTSAEVNQLLSSLRELSR